MNELINQIKNEVKEIENIKININQLIGEKIGREKDLKNLILSDSYLSERVLTINYNKLNNIIYR